MKPGVGKEYVNFLTEACKKNQYLLKRMSGMLETSVTYGTSFTGSDINMVFFHNQFETRMSAIAIFNFLFVFEGFTTDSVDDEIFFAFQLVFSLFPIAHTKPTEVMNENYVCSMQLAPK